MEIMWKMYLRYGNNVDMCLHFLLTKIIYLQIMYLMDNVSALWK